MARTKFCLVCQVLKPKKEFKAGKVCDECVKKLIPEQSRVINELRGDQLPIDLG